MLFNILNKFIINSMAEQNKVEQNNTEGKPQEKKKSKVVLYIVLGIVALLVVAGIVAFFVVKGLFKKGVDYLQDSQDQIEEVIDDSNEEGEDENDSEEEWQLEKSTENGVDDSLESKDMLTSKFPDDIPLSGGKVKSSSYDDLTIDVVLDIDNTVDEIKEWYVEALQENGWIITSQSQDEPLEGWETVEISFESEDGERHGSIEIMLADYQTIPTVTVTEILY
jgi:cytoskeletal protein RodZ